MRGGGGGYKQTRRNARKGQMDLSTHFALASPPLRSAGPVNQGQWQWGSQGGLLRAQLPLQCLLTTQGRIGQQAACPLTARQPFPPRSVRPMVCLALTLPPQSARLVPWFHPRRAG